MKYKSVFIFSCACITMFVTACGFQSDNKSEWKTPQPVAKQEPAQGDAPPISEDKLVAKWDGGQLTLAQIDKFVSPPGDAANPEISSPTNRQKMVFEERKNVTETLVGNYLLILEAQEKGITLTDAEQEELLHRAKGNFDSKEGYEQFLTDANQAENDFINILTNIELGKKCVELRQEEVWNSLTDERMKQYYNRNIDKFTPAHRTFFNRVEIHAKEGRTHEDAKAKAEQLRSEVAEKIAQFQTLEEKRNVMREYARNHSDSFEASYNGGYVTMYHTKEVEEAFSKECMQTAKETPVGELSEVFPSKYGYGFLLVKTQHPSFVHPFKSDAIQKIVPSMMLDEEMKQWRDDLKKKYKLVIYEDMYNEEYEPQQPPIQTVSAP